MTAKETSRFLVSPEPIKELVYHDMDRLDQELGHTLFKYMDSGMVPESDLYVMIRKVEKEIPEDLDLSFTPHTHDVSQLYCLVGEVRLEVTLGVDKHMAVAPVTIFIPAGMSHCFKYAGGTGYIVNIVRSGTYP